MSATLYIRGLTPGGTPLSGEAIRAVLPTGSVRSRGAAWGQVALLIVTAAAGVFAAMVHQVLAIPFLVYAVSRNVMNYRELDGKVNSSGPRPWFFPPLFNREGDVDLRAILWSAVSGVFVSLKLQPERPVEVIEPKPKVFRPASGSSQKPSHVSAIPPPVKGSVTGKGPLFFWNYRF